MADEEKLSVEEVRKTISTALASAFGFVIALVWSNVVMGGLATAGISPTLAGSEGQWTNWAIFMVTALVLTVGMIILIIVIGRWGAKGLRKKAG